jgi:hypothetical protein
MIILFSNLIASGVDEDRGGGLTLVLGYSPDFTSVLIIDLNF